MTISKLADRAFCYGIANFQEHGHACLSTAYNLVAALAAHRWYRNPKLVDQIPELQTILQVGDVVEIGFGLKTFLEKLSLLPSLNPTEWNGKQFVHFGLGSLATLSAGFVAVLILRIAFDRMTIKCNIPGIRSLDFINSSEKNLYLTRTVLNLSLAYFSSNRIFYLCNVAGEAYSLLILSKIRYLEFSKTFPNVPIYKIFPPVIPIPHPDGNGTLIQTIGENSLQAHILKRPRVHVITVHNIHTAVETNYRGLFFPYTGPSSKECAVCYDEKPDVYFCSSHAYHLKCVLRFVQTEMEKMINFKLSKIFFNKNAIISIDKEGLPCCPECRGLPLQVDFKLQMQSNLKIKIDYDLQFEVYSTRYVFKGIRDLSTVENRLFPVQFKIEAPKEFPSFLLSDAFFIPLFLAYNALQAALATIQQFRPELASVIFTVQKVLMVVDGILLAKNYSILLDKIQRKYKINPDFYPFAVLINACALAAISAFAVYKLNSWIIPPINLDEMMKKIDPSIKAEWHTPFIKKVIEWLYINRIIVNVASTYFVSKTRMPIHLINIGLQAFSLFKLSSLILPFIKLSNYCFKSYPKTAFYFTLPFHAAENPCSLTEKGHLPATLKSIHEYCSNFFKNSSWTRWESTTNYKHDYYFWKVTVQPSFLSPPPCGLVPMYNGFESLGERIDIQ